MCKHCAIARESAFERRTLCQFESAPRIALANGGYQIVQRALFGPSLRHFAVDTTLTGVCDVGGCLLKQLAQCKPKGFVHRHILESRDHIAHPSLPFSRSNFETQMRFAQAQPPTLLSILSRPAKELSKKRCKGFYCTAHALSRKE